MKLHMLFGILMLSGVILLIVWAAKNLKAAKLKKTAKWLVVIGIVGGLVTGGCASKWKKHGGDRHSAVMMEVYANHGAEFSEEEWKEIQTEIKEAMKASWKKKRGGDDGDTE